MRSPSFSILKAFVVILLVWVSCTAFPEVESFLGTVALPSLFIGMGYFFNVSNVTKPAEYVERRLRGYYMPFLGWAILLLLLHNLWFHIDLLSTTPSASAVVVQPYSWHEFSQRLWSIGLNMSGYDEVMARSFWVFRALLLSSFGFLILFIIGRKISRFESDREIGWAIFVVSFLFLLWQVLGGLNVTGVAQGGYRELLGVFFMSCGFLFRQYRETLEIDWRTYLLCLCIWLPLAWFFPLSMAPQSDILNFIVLPAPAFAVFMLLLVLSELLAKYDNKATRLLTHIGDNYLCVIAFYVVAFQLVHLLKALVYGLPVSIVAQRADETPWWHGFSLLYLLAGVGLPLLVRYAYLRLTAGHEKGIGKWGDMLFDLVLFIAVTILRILKSVALGLYHFILNFFRALGEFLRASNPKDE